MARNWYSDPGISPIPRSRETYRSRNSRAHGLIDWRRTTGSLKGFELAIKDNGWIGKSFPREAEGGAKDAFSFLFAMQLTV
jgi:hypothetical protein